VKLYHLGRAETQDGVSCGLRTFPAQQKSSINLISVCHKVILSF